MSEPWTEEDVERGAKAMAAVDGHDPDGPRFVRVSDGTPFGICWHGYEEKARAVLAAMAPKLAEALADLSRLFDAHCLTREECSVDELVKIIWDSHKERRAAQSKLAAFEQVVVALRDVKAEADDTSRDGDRKALAAQMVYIADIANEALAAAERATGGQNGAGKT